MRQWMVGLLVLPGVMGVSATLRMPTAVARADESAAVSGGVHAADRLARWMTGRFEAPAQHTDHGTIPAVSMRACVVSAPSIAERVVYAERAYKRADGSEGRPFERRLYAIAPSGSHATVVMREFDLLDPAGVGNPCDASTSRITADVVEERTGCSLRLRSIGGTIAGTTEGTLCPSVLNGANHAARTVSVTANTVTLDDRGLDAAQQVVWSGAPQRYARTATP